MGSISSLLLQINTELPRGESRPVMHKLEIQTPCTKLNTTTMTSMRRAKCDGDNTPGAAECTYITENPKAQPPSITNYTKITIILYINIEKATPPQMRRGVLWLCSAWVWLLALKLRVMSLTWSYEL